MLIVKSTALEPLKLDNLTINKNKLTINLPPKQFFTLTNIYP